MEMMNWSGNLQCVVIAMASSFVMSLLIILTKRWHGSLSLDSDLNGVQKFHITPVPRIGGIAMLAGVLIACCHSLSQFDPFSAAADEFSTFFLVLAGAPVFLAGLIEDLTKRVSASSRLIAAFASALLACWLLDAVVDRLDIWGVDQMLLLTPVAVLLTAFAVAGVTNSINIIDGFHGVASSAVALILGGMGVLAWQYGDRLVTTLALVGAGAAVGFLLANYPTGRIFMGDGGAYFMGFWCAEVAVLAISRNSGINAWQVLAIFAYPVIEVLYSVYRKAVLRRMSPGVPDRLHMHMLIHRRIFCKLIPRSSRFPWLRNAAVALVTTAWIGSMTVLSVLAGDSVAAAVAIVFAQVVGYLTLYVRLIRGRWCFVPILGFGLRPSGRREMA
jgi:UDP-N-acetylmuramyl pentapeptide phosphotransferase/UDP-N-acetylglucosamine-1-phosphate transferase